MNRERKIIIVSGFSGVGKGTVIQELMKRNGNIEVVKSYTTRKKRNDSDYYTFVTKNQFCSLAEQGSFLETNVYADEYYGTPILDVNRILESGKIPLVEIDPNGYIQIMESGYFSRDEIVSAFIAVDGITLYERLSVRGTETKESIIKRLRTAMQESEMIPFYNAVILNRTIDEACTKLEQIIKGQEKENSEFDKELFRKIISSIVINL